MLYEHCKLCDEPTGRAGPFDDSLYTEDGRGPLCERCYNGVTKHAAWKPIETAPKDGRKIEASFQSVPVHWEQLDETGGRWVTPDGLTASIPFTHWRPF